jgi:uncharacterized protein with HEPN domain
LIDERLAVHLDTMRQGAQDAIAFVHGMSQEQFLTDQKTQAAVMMAFIRIGESATRIEKRFPDFVDAHPDWPWLQMRAMRNRGVHGYDSINFTIIWDTCNHRYRACLVSFTRWGRWIPETIAARSRSRGTG